jgi:hypothetical protein
MTRRRVRTRADRLTLLFTAALCVGVPTTARTARPPAGNTYYTVLVGVAAPYDVSTFCFDFDSKTICSTDGAGCGSWRWTGGRGGQAEFTFDISPLEDGDQLRAAGVGRVDTRGRKSSIGGTGNVSASGERFNFSFAGRETPRRRCLDMLHSEPGGENENLVVVGSGTIGAEARSLPEFSKVALDGLGKLEVRHGESERLVVTADHNLLPYMVSEVRGDTLFLGNAPKVDFRTDHEILYQLTVSEIDRLVLSGTTIADLGGIDVRTLDIDASGISMIEIRGHADVQRVRLAGVVGYDATRLQSRHVDAHISGVSTALVRASETLRGRVQGLSSLAYIGNPTVQVTVDSGCFLRRIGN